MKINIATKLNSQYHNQNPDHGQNQINISSVEMMEKTKTSINFKFNLIISDLKNFTKLLSELKQRQYRFKIIRHTNKKYAFFKKLFKGLKKN